MKKMLWIGVALLVAGGGWWWWKGRSAASAAPSWRKAWVQRGDLVLGAQATGNVQPQNRVAIRPPVSGRLESILVREGDWVKKGQTLAWMSTSDRAALLDAARAKGPEQVKRWEELYKATPLIAPISGTVILRNAEVGQNVTGADAPLVISDRLIVKAQVDETDIAELRRGQPALLTLDAYPDQKIEARVNHIAYEARTVSNVTIYDVDVLPLKVPPSMRSGMTANVTFITEARKDALLLAAEALQSDADGGSFVYVPAGKESGKKRAKSPSPRPPSASTPLPFSKKMGEGSGVRVPREAGDDAPMPEPVSKAVKTGLSDGTSVEILSGLEEGDRVLIKQVSLPTAATTNSPLSMQRPQQRRPRGAR